MADSAPPPSKRPKTSPLAAAALSANRGPPPPTFAPITDAARQNTIQALPTPLCMVTCRQGAVPHLMPDVLAQVQRSVAAAVGGGGAAQPLLLQVPMLDLWHKPEHSVLSGKGGTLAEFCGLASNPTLLTAQRPGAWAFGGASTGDYTSGDTERGLERLSPKAWAALALAARAGGFEALSDHVASASTRRDRIEKSVARTASWLDECCAATGDGRAGERWGAVQGAGLEAQRVKCAAEVAKRDVAGFVLSSFGTGESADERACLLSAVIAQLPAAKPRIICGMDSPEEIFALVDMGVDAFEGTYPFMLAELGFAQVDAVDPAAEGAEGAAEQSGPLKLSLHDTQFAEDLRPLLPGCCCPACDKHSRAYIHHLLRTHEMLGIVLLTAHNLHRHLLLFETMRRNIAAGTWAEYKQRWLAARGRGS